MASRDKQGRFFSAIKKKKTVMKNRQTQIDHTYGYVGKYFCDGANCKKDCNTVQHADIPKTASRDSWKQERMIIELDVLLEGLRLCVQCKLGPIPLTLFNIVSELRKGIRGYFYVRCGNLLVSCCKPSSLWEDSYAVHILFGLLRLFVGK